MGRNFWIVLLSAVLALGSSSGSASDGALEINQDCAAVGCFAGDTAGFPVSISVPGRYRLTSNLNTPTSGNVRAIEVGGNTPALFDIDLNGFELFGGGTCTGNPTVTSCTAGSTGVGILAFGNGHTVHIHGGAIRGFEIGMTLVAIGSGSSFEDLVVSESTGTQPAIIPQTAGTGAVFFDRVRIVRNNGNGMQTATAGRIFIRNSTFAGNRLQGLQLPAGLTIEDSIFADNGGVGVNCSAACAMGRNSFFNNSGGPTGTQYNAAFLRDMGGNVCDDGACP